MNLELMIPVGFGIIFVATWIRVILGAREHPAKTFAPQAWHHICCICSKQDEDVDKVAKYSENGHIYIYQSFYFHMGCVVDVVCNPNRFSEHTVNYALDIVRCLEIYRKKKKEAETNKIKRRLQQISDCKKACKKVKSDSLLPS